MSVIPFLRLPSRSEGFRLSERSQLEMTCGTSAFFSPSVHLSCSSTSIFMVHISSSIYFLVLRYVTPPPSRSKCTTLRKLYQTIVVSYLHSLRMRSSGLLLIFLGKSIFSMPFKMNVYVIIWSLPEKGGLWSNNRRQSTFPVGCTEQRKGAVESGRRWDQTTRQNPPASEQLKHQDPQRPEVHTEVVALV